MATKKELKDKLRDIFERFSLSLCADVFRDPQFKLKYDALEDNQLIPSEYLNVIEEIQNRPYKGKPLPEWIKNRLNDYLRFCKFENYKQYTPAELINEIERKMQDFKENLDKDKTNSILDVLLCLRRHLINLDKKAIPLSKKISLMSSLDEAIKHVKQTLAFQSYDAKTLQQLDDIVRGLYQRNLYDFTYRHDINSQKGENPARITSGRTIAIDEARQLNINADDAKRYNIYNHYK